jgi:sigma 54 modulation/S30EA-like ribosomal protein
MEIHINTGNGMENKESLERWADGEIRGKLGRFADSVRRIEVHLSDVNGARGGGADKRCMIEAHLAQHPPVAVTHEAPNIDLAFRGAESKAQRALDSTLGKLHDHRDHASIRTQPEIL